MHNQHPAHRPNGKDQSMLSNEGMLQPLPGSACLYAQEGGLAKCAVAFLRNSPFGRQRCQFKSWSILGCGAVVHKRRHPDPDRSCQSGGRCKTTQRSCARWRSPPFACRCWRTGGDRRPPKLDRFAQWSSPPTATKRQPGWRSLCFVAPASAPPLFGGGDIWRRGHARRLWYDRCDGLGNRNARHIAPKDGKPDQVAPRPSQ